MRYLSAKSPIGRVRSFLCLLCTVTAVAGCPGTPAPAPEEGVIDVDIQNIAFSPKDVTIRRGETVRWTNLESASIPHTVTSGAPGEEDAGDLFDSGNLSAGQSFSQTFDELGEFTYFCRVHSDDPDMVGATVTVTEE